VSGPSNGYIRRSHEGFVSLRTNDVTPITPCLWFYGLAEDAARFWAAIFPDSRVDGVHAAASDTPSGEKGTVITVEFTLRGQRFIGLNGVPDA
jgi:predicted 3-demethylubiquinone-9 3-methyltransferase (glyoxalase superfamily)